MSKKSFIDSVEVKDPCTEDWEQMQGNDLVRFCSHCSKHVNNLSEMTRKEATRLVRASNGNLCIRYIPNPATKRPMFAEQLMQITRRTPGIAAGVISASMSLSTLSYAQAEAPSPVPTEEIQTISEVQQTTNEDEQNAADETVKTEGSLEGIIWDDEGKPVQGVEINLVDAESSENIGNQTTDGKGHYIFEELEPGTYLIRIYSAKGTLRKAMPEITLVEGQKYVQNFHVTLVEPSKDNNEETGFGFGGAMAFVPYSLPLSQAVANDNFELAMELIAKGSKLNDKDKNYDDITPLFLAVENGNTRMVRLLIDKGADVNAKDKTKRTPLMFIDEDATPELIGLLVQAGAKVNAKDKNGSTALLQTIWSINVEVMNALIKAGADVNAEDNDGDTLLIKAADQNKLDIVKALIMAGAEVNARNKIGESAWDKTTSVEIEKYLEEYGSIVDYGNITVEKPSTKENDESSDD